MRRSKLLALGVALAACLAVAGFPTPVRAGADSACGPAGVLVLRSLHLEATPSKKTLHPGDRFKVKIKVTRPAHEDPVGAGVEFEPPASFPAEDVITGLSIWVGDQTYFFNIGLSDANGMVTLPMKVPASAEPGPAFAAASGRHWIKQDCPDILEDGFRAYERFITIKL